MTSLWQGHALLVRVLNVFINEYGSGVGVVFSAPHYRAVSQVGLEMMTFILQVNVEGWIGCWQIEFVKLARSPPFATTQRKNVCTFLAQVYFVMVFVVHTSLR